MHIPCIMCIPVYHWYYIMYIVYMWMMSLPIMMLLVQNLGSYYHDYYKHYDKWTGLHVITKPSAKWASTIIHIAHYLVTMVTMGNVKVEPDTPLHMLLPRKSDSVHTCICKGLFAWFGKGVPKLATGSNPGPVDPKPNALPLLSYGSLQTKRIWSHN